MHLVETGRPTNAAIHRTDRDSNDSAPGNGGYENSIAHGLPYTYTFTWTPPATNVGNITIYVAANAGVGNPPSQTGDHIYSTQYTLTPFGWRRSTPAIMSGGIVNASEFGGFSAACGGLLD